MLSLRTVFVVFLILFLVSVLHILLDSCQTVGTQIYHALKSFNPELADFLAKLYKIVYLATGLVYKYVDKMLDLVSSVLDRVSEFLS